MMRGRGDMGKADEEEEQMQLLSHYYSAALSTPTPPEGAKPKRRRRKRKVEGGGGTGGMKTKRKLSAEQAKFLEMSFGCEHKLESARKDRLAAELGLDPRQVAVWFQNRRARWKSKQLEGEYSRLNSTHNSMTLEKCRLEAEVRQLKEKLVEAEKEIERLLSSAGRGVVSTAAEGEHCSPSTSFSAAETNYHEAVDHEQVLVGGGGGATFGLGGGVVDQHDVDNFLFMADNAYYAPPPFLVNGSVEWMFW